MKNFCGDIRDEILRLKKAVDEADAVIIGAGAGLSTSAGFVYTGERLQKYFGDFVKQYNIPDMYSGGFMVQQLSPEIMWAYWSRYIYINRYMDPPRPVYENLLDLVKNKEYFVLTTNVDHCFQKAGFDKHRLFYTQGDYGLWQCSKPCHDKTYDNKETVKKMLCAQGFSFGDSEELIPPAKNSGPDILGDDRVLTEETAFERLSMEIPAELIPYCPVCGRPMTMNLRADDTFVQDEGWYEASQRYSNFLSTHKDMKVLFMELSVGFNTPGIIKIPFIRMTGEWQDATYACLNLGEAFAPDDIKDRAICINGDIGDILKELG